MNPRTEKKPLLRCPSVFTSAILIAAFLVCFAPAAFSQTVRATPTPTPEDGIPLVISRDDDIEDLIRERTGDPERRPSAAQRPRTSDADQTALALDSMSEKEQKRVLFYLDILTRLEQRAESLRSQLIDMIEKQNNVTTKIQQVEYNLRPEVISGYTSLSGSFRPEDLREQRESELEIEKRNLENLLGQIETNISNLESNLIRADQMAEKVRLTFEAVLEEALFNSQTP